MFWWFRMASFCWTVVVVVVVISFDLLKRFNISKSVWNSLNVCVCVCVRFRFVQKTKRTEEEKYTHGIFHMYSIGIVWPVQQIIVVYPHWNSLSLALVGLFHRNAIERVGRFCFYFHAVCNCWLTRNILCVYFCVILKCFIFVFSFFLCTSIINSSKKKNNSIVSSDILNA